MPFIMTFSDSFVVTAHSLAHKRMTSKFSLAFLEKWINQKSVTNRSVDDQLINSWGLSKMTHSRLNELRSAWY